MTWIIPWKNYNSFFAWNEFGVFSAHESRVKFRPGKCWFDSLRRYIDVFCGTGYKLLSGIRKWRMKHVLRAAAALAGSFAAFLCNNTYVDDVTSRSTSDQTRFPSTTTNSQVGETRAWLVFTQMPRRTVSNRQGRRYKVLPVGCYNNNYFVLKNMRQLKPSNHYQSIQFSERRRRGR